MASNSDPTFVQETFQSLDSKRVNQQVEGMVRHCIKQGYKKIKGVLENHLVVRDDQSTHMIYQTTILATMNSNVDISQK
ncbi:MAG: hypothetical protein UW41_C0018G0019 [Candidatus Collierbacteria bacterium GW2011_GWC2_44_18]|uniref:Uncharacterized protein n=2 Tax=Microgenomates group TaxID=1794810 RepID=A0A0G1J4T8_9BACT|nr:MAG: hypothetical protein UW41_C0018G0019 [Candidatus Collierbacteria bacterium GW2011_GWC2_44_18]KKT66343.1 MAG: hypothetical protein UW60_C0025G0003 [Candidatus Woesebacteria bacterium GW2011_GWA2_44_33]